MEKIYYGKQWIEEDDIEAVVKVMRGDYLTQGPYIDEFEKKIAAYAGTKYAVAFCNGTAALHGAYYAAGVGMGDEVITTPLTFVATANAALYLGAKPVFVDIDAENYCIDIEAIRSKLSDKTKVVAPVSYGGYPVNIKKIKEIVGEKIVIIEDAAHALGAVRDGNRVGADADMTMFSFHPVKHITTGEGGVIVTNSKEYYDKMRLFRSHGITKDPALMEKNDGGWYYEMIELGYNYRITDIQAALGISQLGKIERFVERRREIAEMYNAAFGKIANAIVPPDNSKAVNSYHLYPLLINDRKSVYDELKNDNIFLQVNYIPVHLQPYYREKYGYKEGDFPVCEDFYQREISLPMYPKLTNEQVDYIIQKMIEKIGNL